jgi:hypothetical protein
MTNNATIASLNVTSVNGIANVYTAPFNIGRIVSVTPLGSGCMIQYDANTSSGSYVTYVVSNSYSSIKSLIQQYTPGLKVELPVIGLNGTVIPSANYYVRIDSIVDVEPLASNASQSVVTFVNPQGRNFKYTVNLTQAAIVKAANIDTTPVKYPARAASTANVNIASAPATIDGVTLANGDRVLLKNQSTPSQNGIYVFAAASSPLTLAADFQTGEDVFSGIIIVVEEGSVNAATIWELETPNPITVGTTSLTFIQSSSASTVGGSGTATNLAYFSAASTIASLPAIYTPANPALGAPANILFETQLQIADVTDTTKIAQFAVSTITTGTTRTFTFPDADGTLTALGNASTGTGSVVLATSPTLTTPTLGVATATSINKVAITAPAAAATLTIANNKTLTCNNTLTFAGTDATTMTFPATSGTVATLNANQSFTGNVAFGGQIAKVQTPFTAGTDTTAGWTLANVKTGLVAGIIKSTTAAAVTITLDSVANIITALATAGITLTTGSEIQFILDNSQGANNLTLAVDGGGTITAAKQVSAGDTGTDVNLVVASTSTGTKVGRFALYITSATTGVLFRIG